MTIALKDIKLEWNEVSLLSQNLKILAEDSIKSPLIVLEGPTGSGKTTLIKYLATKLQITTSRKTRIIPEAARLVIAAVPPDTYELQSLDRNTDTWQKIKLHLQLRILKRQLVDMQHYLTYETKFDGITLMDRSGASTAAHTHNLLNPTAYDKILEICQFIAELATTTLVTQNLGILRQDGIRYQTSMLEIDQEEIDIATYLEKWAISSTILTSRLIGERINTALTKIHQVLDS